jgi:quinol monooxygenase YgiN
MIHVVATVEVVPGKRAEFLAILQANVPTVLQEDGCMEYLVVVDMQTDIAAQLSPRSDIVVVIEKWRDLPALKAHLQAAHMVDYRQKVRDLVRSASLQVLQSARS